MRICEYTVPELNQYRKLCNFLDDELQYFEMKAKGKSNVQVAVQLCISEAQVSKLATKVKSKIKRVDKYTNSIEKS